MSVHKSDTRRRGFTILEISIVLTIIGLIVGGIFIGQDLIAAFEIRRIISQKEAFETALNVFRDKYNTFPGDLTPPQANAFGFQTRSGASGHGDGNHILSSCSSGAWLETDAGCENVLFWRDLSTAGLIEGTFNTATDAVAANLSGSTIPLYFPKGARSGSYFFPMTAVTPPVFAGETYYVLTGLVSTDASGVFTTAMVLTPNEVYSIDTKIDDGIYSSGRVLAASGDAPFGFYPLAGLNCVNFNAYSQIVYNVAYNGPACGVIMMMNSW